MNTNSQPMLGKNRYPHRTGFYCNCIYCHDGDKNDNGMLRARQKRSWKREDW